MKRQTDLIPIRCTACARLCGAAVQWRKASGCLTATRDGRRCDALVRHYSAAWARFATLTSCWSGSRPSLLPVTRRVRDWRSYWTSGSVSKKSLPRQRSIVLISSSGRSGLTNCPSALFGSLSTVPSLRIWHWNVGKRHMRCTHRRCAIEATALFTTCALESSGSVTPLKIFCPPCTQCGETISKVCRTCLVTCMTSMCYGRQRSQRRRSLMLHRARIGDPAYWTRGTAASASTAKKWLVRSHCGRNGEKSCPKLKACVHSLSNDCRFGLRLRTPILHTPVTSRTYHSSFTFSCL